MRTTIVFGIIASILPSTLAAEQPAPPSPRQAEPPAAKAEPSPAPPSIPEDIRKQYSEFVGKALAFGLQQRFEHMADKTQQPLIDADLVRKTFMENIARPLDAENIQKEEEAIVKTYNEAYKAYSTAKAARFLKENAKKPGIILLENGMQCQVTTDKDPAKNYRIEEADSVDVGVPDSDFPTHSRMSSSGVLDGFDELSDISRELLKELPEGTEWIVYVPASAMSEEFKADANAFLVLTFRMSKDSEHDDKDATDGRDEDIEDEE